MNRSIDIICEDRLVKAVRGFLSFAFFLPAIWSLCSIERSFQEYVEILVFAPVFYIAIYFNNRKLVAKKKEKKIDLEIRNDLMFYRDRSAEVKHTLIPVIKKEVVTVTSYAKDCYFRIRVTPSMVSVRDWHELVKRCT